MSVSRRTQESRARHALSVLLLCAVALEPVVLGAQTVTDPRDTTHAQHQAPFFIAKDAYLAAGFVVGTIVLFPLDRGIATSLTNPNTQANRFFKNASTGFEAIASPGAYVIGGSLYIVGRVGKME